MFAKRNRIICIGTPLFIFILHCYIVDFHIATFLMIVGCFEKASPRFRAPVPETGTSQNGGAQARGQRESQIAKHHSYFENWYHLFTY
jgi:hypothetical protein